MDLSSDVGASGMSGLNLSALADLRSEMVRFMMQYKFGIDEVLTKISILREEFNLLNSYNPIEHISSRVKTPESIVEKVTRKGIEPSFAAIRREITDIAGIRITCSFIQDTYRVFDALVAQDDVRLIQVKDYIRSPKPNGYKSLHAIVEIPVFLSDGPIPVAVEIQIRTIAMDFWASLEHKIFYKYQGAVPLDLVESLTEAAKIAADLDERMERLHAEVRGAGPDSDRDGDLTIDEGLLRRFQDLSRRFTEANAPVGQSPELEV